MSTRPISISLAALAFMGHSLAGPIQSRDGPDAALPVGDWMNAVINTFLDTQDITNMSYYWHLAGAVNVDWGEDQLKENQKVFQAVNLVRSEESEKADNDGSLVFFADQYINFIKDASKASPSDNKTNSAIAEAGQIANKACLDDMRAATTSAVRNYKAFEGKALNLKKGIMSDKAFITWTQTNDDVYNSKRIICQDARKNFSDTINELKGNNFALIAAAVENIRPFTLVNAIGTPGVTMDVLGSNSTGVDGNGESQTKDKKKKPKTSDEDEDSDDSDKISSGDGESSGDEESGDEESSSGDEESSSETEERKRSLRPRQEEQQQKQKAGTGASGSGFGSFVPLIELQGLDGLVGAWGDGAEDGFTYDSSKESTKETTKNTNSNSDRSINFIVSDNEKQDKETKEREYQLKATSFKMTFGGLALVDIKYGAWFDNFRIASAVRQGNDEPTKKMQPAFDKYMGTKGKPGRAAQFNRKALVAFKPSVELTFSNKDEKSKYEKIHKTKETKFLGIFGKKTESTEETNTDEKNNSENSVSFTEEGAKILGFVQGNYWDSKSL